MSFATGGNVPINTDAEFRLVQFVSPGWSRTRRCFVAPSEADHSAPIVEDPDGVTVTQGDLVLRGFVSGESDECSMSPALAEQVRLTLEARSEEARVRKFVTGCFPSVFGGDDVS